MKRLLLLCALPAAFAASAFAASFETVTISKAKTSIYVGAVTITVEPLRRTGDVYSGSYDATVFPLFFYNEKGTLSVNFTAAQQEDLERGDRVAISGSATSGKGETYVIDGHANASAPGSHEGTIKVKIHVSKRIVLIFNTRYSY